LDHEAYNYKVECEIDAEQAINLPFPPAADEIYVSNPWDFSKRDLERGRNFEIKAGLGSEIKKVS
jgi:hypothetical protein